MFNINVHWSQTPDLVAIKIVKLCSWDGDALNILCLAQAALTPGAMPAPGQTRESGPGFP